MSLAVPDFKEFHVGGVLDRVDRDATAEDQFVRLFQLVTKDYGDIGRELVEASLFLLMSMPQEN